MRSQDIFQMTLELEDGTVFEQPSEHDIEQAIGSLGNREDSFAILSQDSTTYVQTAGSRDTEYYYDLEYQEEDTKHHYRVPWPVSHDVVVSVFKRYAKGDVSWKDECQWEPMELDSAELGSAGGSGCMSVIMLILVLVMMFFGVEQLS